MLPNFLGIGAPRTGTRWLAKCLSSHRDIFMPPDEIYFFISQRYYPYSKWGEGLDYYCQLFEDASVKKAKIIGEITPVYLYDKGSCELIHNSIPDVKIICTLRNQSERANSVYRLFMNLNPDIYFNSNYSFELFLINNQGLIDEGFYLDYLQKYFNLFANDQILVMLYDDLVENPGNYLNRVFEFLGIQDQTNNENDKTKEIYKVINSRNTVSKSNNHFKNSNVFLKIVNFLTLTKKQKIITEKIDMKNPRNIITEQTKKMFFDIYNEHNQKLSQFLERDLTHWNK